MYYENSEYNLARVELGKAHGALQRGIKAMEAASGSEKLMLNMQIEPLNTSYLEAKAKVKALEDADSALYKTQNASSLERAINRLR